MTKPLYLLIGKNDPWLIPNIYHDFLKHCPTAFGKWLDAGHCPHDEIPDEINKLIITFLDQFLFNMPPSGAEMD
jgi:pimeloyl-ACP methyl ester carboxylesterase